MRNLLCLVFLMNTMLLTAQLELRRSDDFGINIEAKCNPDGPGRPYLEVLAPNEKELSFYNVIDGSCGHLVDASLYMSFLPAPWDASMEDRLNDSIVHVYKNMLEDGNSRYGGKYKYDLLEPTDYQIEQFPTAKSYIIIKSKLENEGIVNKEAWVVQNYYQLVIGYKDHRITMVKADFGASEVVIMDGTKGKEKKKNKNKFKAAFNEFKKGLTEGSSSSNKPNAKEIAKSIYKTLSEIQFNESPLEGFEGEYGYFFAMKGINKVGDGYATKHHTNGRVLRNQKGFLNVGYSDGQETIEKRKTYGPMVTLKEGGGDLKADVLKKLDFVSVNRMYEKKIKFSDFDKNYLHIIEPKKDVFYLIATYNDPDRSDKLLGKYGLRHKELINVYVKNRADMPASWEEARKTSIELIDRYYNYLRSGIAVEEEKYSKLSEPHRGKAMFLYSEKGSDEEKEISKLNVMTDKGSVRLRFYMKDGMQPTWMEKDFIATITLGGQTKDIPVKSAGTSGGFAKSPGSHYFEDYIFSYSEVTDKQHDNSSFRYMSEESYSIGMYFLHQVLNEFNVKEGFSGKMTIKLKNSGNQVLSEGSLHLTIPKGSFERSSSLCLLPSYGTHLKEEEAKIAELIKHRFDVKKVLKVMMSSSIWSDDRRGYRYGRYISARVMFENKKGEIKCQWFQFYNKYFVASGTYAPSYSVHEEGLARPINCNCKM
jgi:hypothetical protein